MEGNINNDVNDRYDLLRGETILNISTRYVYHLDDLRRHNKIRVLDFVSDVCSERTYRRYLSGENSISQKNLSLLIKKFNMTDHDFYNSFHRSDTQEYLKVSEVYHHLVSNDLGMAKELILTLSGQKFVSKLACEFLEYCRTYIIYVEESIPDYSVIDMFAKIIDYPNCLKKKTFNFIEIIVINRISSLEVKHGVTRALTFLYDIVTKNELIYLSSNNKFVMPTVYSELTKSLGILKDFEKANTICSKGIEFSIKSHDNYSLPHLYYMKALILFKQHRLLDFQQYLYKCLYTCCSTADTYLFNHFSNLIVSEFDFNEAEVMQIKTNCCL